MRKLTLVFSLLLLSVQGVWAGPSLSGSGTLADPFRVESGEDFKKMRDDVQDDRYHYEGKLVVLTKDIVVSDMDMTTWGGARFKGFFDGCGHTIEASYKLTKRDERYEFASLFGPLEDAVIMNVRVRGNIKTMYLYQGGITGLVEGSVSIINCHSEVVIDAYEYSGSATEYVGNVNDGAHGGFVGIVYDDACLNLINCSFTGSINLNDDAKNCAGFIGWVKGDGIARLQNCFYNGQSTTTRGGCKTFARSKQGEDLILENCYYINPFKEGETSQGTQIANNNTTILAALGNGWQEEGGAIRPKADMIYGHSFAGYGTPEIPYKIASARDWNALACRVNSGENFSGSYFTLLSDIDVHLMVGKSGQFFSGIFNGNGKTLNFQYVNEQKYCAPFRYVKGATITDLHTAGTIVTEAKYAAGIVARVEGSGLTLERCRSSVVINSRVSGDGTHGGLVSHSGNGTTVTITDCLFDGKLLGSSTHHCGGLMGFANEPVTITHCLFDPSEVSFGTSGSKRLIRYEDDENPIISGSYYTRAWADAQGSDGSSMSVSELVSALGGNWKETEGRARPRLTSPFAAQLSGSGTEGDPYLIASVGDWHIMANSVFQQSHYYKLLADITVDEMVGNNGNAFRGVFDGNGRTLTLNLSSNDGESQALAPFSYLTDATIKNLRVGGRVTTCGVYPASIASNTSGTCQIENCYSNVAITYNNESALPVDAGAIVAYVKDELSITGCTFNGSIQYGTWGYRGGSFVGFTESGAQVRLKNCIFSSSLMDVNNNGNTSLFGFTYYYCYFVSGKTPVTELSNCYYKVGHPDNNTYFFDEDGKKIYTVTGDEYTQVTLAGTPVSYNVSGITAYQNGETFYPGLVFGGKIYGGSGESLHLLLTNKSGEYDTFTASAGTLTGSAPSYTLAMGAQDVTISPTFSKITLWDDKDNADLLTMAHGKTTDATLHRTLRAGVWNSFCAPFDISAETIASVFGAGTVVKKLGLASHDAETGKLTLEFTDVSSITAGHPYLIRIGNASNVENPVFANVTINKNAVNTESTAADFIPVFSSTHLPGSDMSVLFIAGDGTLSYPDAGGNIKAFRAYLQLKGTAAGTVTP